MVTDILLKVNQLFVEFLRLSERITFKVKTSVAIFQATFGGNWATFSITSGHTAVGIDH